MKVQTTVCLLVILSLGYAQTQTWEDIDSTPFGRQMIDTLQIRLTTGEPIEKFIDIIHGVEISYESEQKEDDQKNRDDQEICDKDLGFLENDNNNLLRRLTDLQTAIDTLSAAISRKNGIITSKQSWLDDLNGKIQGFEEVRALEVQEFNKVMEEHNYAQFVIETVKRMFSESDLGFLQIESGAEGLKKVSNHLREASEKIKSFVHKKSYGKFFKVIAFVAEKAQLGNIDELVSRIFGLCDQLLKNIQESGQLETAANEKREQDFQRKMALLRRDANALQSQINTITNEVIQLSTQLENVEREFTDTQERQQLKQKQVDDRKRECDENNFLYAQTRQQRDRDREVASQILGLFHANKRDFEEYVKLRTDAGSYGNLELKTLG